MTSSDSTLLLVGSIFDSWDRLRENSFHILLHFPSPLPGISNEDTLKKLIASSMKLVCSPRVRESDAGALSLRLIFKKYVLELDLVVRITSLALWVVSADAWHLPEDMDEMIDEDNLLMEIPYDEHIPSSECENNNSKPSHDDGRSSEQIVMVGCWLAMKEVSLLLGTIIRKVPLPRNTSSDLSDLEGHSVDFSSDSVLDLEQLKTIGNHFLEVLLKMKHNGAIDKTRAGFTALCNRLLCSNDSRYGFLFFCFCFCEMSIG
ncbi:hypothetical protein V8G54_011865 [Vigna mungo]|uniref:DUF2428 domain-containing protein n=1 Tax=Vigna mungo TaxID=3915 RepID=A0AAQ3S3G3_VIGMU